MGEVQPEGCVQAGVVLLQHGVDPRGGPRGHGCVEGVFGVGRRSESGDSPPRGEGRSMPLPLHGCRGMFPMINDASSAPIMDTERIESPSP